MTSKMACRARHSPRRQIEKDFEPLVDGRVKKIDWMFYRSPVTGKVGPTGPLREYLDRRGIGVIEVSGGGAVMVDWDGFEVFAPRDLARVGEVSGRQARALFRLRMGLLNERINELKGFAARNGFVLDGSDESFADFGAWLNEVVEPDYERLPMPQWPWLPFAFDLALFVGQCFLDQFPHLKWEFVSRGKTRVDYHQPVVGGFRTEYRVSFDWWFESMVFRIVASKAPIASESVVFRGRELPVGQYKSEELDPNWLMKRVQSDRRLGQGDVVLRAACEEVAGLGIGGMLALVRHMAGLPVGERAWWANDKALAEVEAVQVLFRPF